MGDGFRGKACLYFLYPTLDGRVVLKNPPESQSGKVFRLRGKGAKPVRGGAQGDLLCRISVETPVNLTAKQKTLLRDFENSMGQGGTRHNPQATFLAGWREEVFRWDEAMSVG